MVVATALAAVACGGDDDESADTGGGEAAVNQDVSGSISTLGIWAGEEQKSFQAVIDKFKETYPNVSVKYRTAGDNLPTVLGTAVQGGNPPDVAFIAQPATIQEFATGGDAKPLDFAKDAAVTNLGQSVADTATFDGKLYGLLFKAANKSLGLVQHAGLRGRGRRAARRPTRTSRRRPTPSRPPACPRTPWPGPTDGP